MSTPLSRRDVLRATALAAGGYALHRLAPASFAGLPEGIPGAPKVPQDPSVSVLNPRDRVPLSFIIDDSTVLVNMGHFCMPQFAAAWPQRVEYKRPWKDWPREIPNDFVREFGEWCAGNGVRGKWSVVPNPACVGWLDRELPGWSKADLRDGLKVVREVMAPNWDIHPEMITHTRVIDLKTGRPLDPMGDATMENSYPPKNANISADYLATYIAYALKILKNCDIACEGATTPGGFGNADRSALSLAMRDAVSDVFAPEIPHYFKYIADGDEPIKPILEHVEGLDTDHPRLVDNVPGGTGDWLGSWDGDRPPLPDKYATPDASAGRVVELIERGGPAVLFAHWAGFYSCGKRDGFEAIKRVITSINTKYADRTVWMKLSELSRYWAAKELTRIERANSAATLTAPFACPAFTLKLTGAKAAAPAVSLEGKPVVLSEVGDNKAMKPGTWQRRGGDVVVCLDLAKGKTQVSV
ncbi:MAG TPA: hypothetical protein VMZ71_11800 [Gemmataceae bacterium]|nr:hypothetical protein [Gemmataceae bacterium]